MSDHDGYTLYMPEVANDSTAENYVMPFQLDMADIRGRITRLGSVLDGILSAQDYPPPVAGLLGEAVLLASTLAGMLKYDGIFTLQFSGDGPVKTLVADVTGNNALRGYAGFDQERLDAVLAQKEENAEVTLRDLAGKGYLAFTVDQGQTEDRYQGLVELSGPDLATCVQHYFEQSEQIRTDFSVACASYNGHWRGAGLMIQKLPSGTAESGTAENPHGPRSVQDTDHLSPEQAAEENWRRACVLMESCAPQELTSPDLPAEDLLYRLFHEEQVRVFPKSEIHRGCRCNRDKLANVLASLSEQDLADSVQEDGQITMTCAFCNIDFRFNPDRIRSGGNADGNPPG